MDVQGRPTATASGNSDPARPTRSRSPAASTTIILVWSPARLLLKRHHRSAAVLQRSVVLFGIWRSGNARWLGVKRNEVVGSNSQGEARSPERRLTSASSTSTANKSMGAPGLDIIRDCQQIQKRTKQQHEDETWACPAVGSLTMPSAALVLLAVSRPWPRDLWGTTPRSHPQAPVSGSISDSQRRAEHHRSSIGAHHSRLGSTAHAKTAERQTRHRRLSTRLLFATASPVTAANAIGMEAHIFVQVD